ncbi:regenerating islet-derived protein 3-gamma-like [Sphaeramia orbicularis]|uniref:regenerating islet-derived protein 3-gamma-like n=1 Tax=Sphaeramia orbicularis TaxID=375764 RepID=UPI00117EBD8F|nr:regenerating islet-derived protein 3-gamma-like [Sphaeramia orbicularis]
MTWQQAQYNCRSKYTDLVTVRNSSENDIISKLLFRNSWIGLHRNTWQYWSDKTLSVFTNWDKTPFKVNPSHTSCALLNPATGKWREHHCGSRFFFICQKDTIQPEFKTTLKLKFQSGVNLNDPAVQDQILKKIHGDLNKSGLADFKLRWTQINGQVFHEEPKKKNEGSGG